MHQSGGSDDDHRLAGIADYWLPVIVYAEEMLMHRHASALCFERRLPLASD